MMFIRYPVDSGGRKRKLQGHAGQHVRHPVGRSGCDGDRPGQPVAEGRNPLEAPPGRRYSFSNASIAPAAVMCALAGLAPVTMRPLATEKGPNGSGGAT